MQLPATQASTDAEAQSLLDRFFREIDNDNVPYNFALDDLPAGRAILDLSPELKARILVLAMQGDARAVARGAAAGSMYSFGLRQLSIVLLRRQLPLSDTELSLVLNRAIDHPCYMWIPWRGILRAIECYLQDHPMTLPLRDVLQRALNSLRGDSTSEARPLRDRIKALLDPASEPDAHTVPLRRGDPWSDAALSYLESLPPDRRAAWGALLCHASAISGTKPSQKWLKQTTPLIEAAGAAAFAEQLAQWLNLIGQPRAGSPGNPPPMYPPETVPDAHGTDLLKGLIWAASTISDPKLLEAIIAAAEVCFKKVPGFGPRCVKIGNACLWFLSTLDGDDAVAQLSRLRDRAKHASIRSQIDKALARMALRRGQTPEDLIEIAVPTFGLELPGILRTAVAGHTAELTITGSTTTQLQWLRPDGKAAKSPPKAVREAEPAAVKAILKNRRAIEQILPVQRNRIERLLLSQRTWSMMDWQARYLHHPLLASLSRRLIWEFHAGQQIHAAMPIDDALVDSAGRPVAVPDAATTRVRLWHPIRSTIDQVTAWRTFLTDRQLTQPFKQAHREVYILTDAERATETYSNRFAAHILRQHQLHALCRERGWSSGLMGAFDPGDSTPTLSLPQYGLKVQFYVDNSLNVEDQTLAGISLYVSTDQVRFEEESGAAVPLERIDPIVFSEVMRDVDLFVGVASIGNDPDWQASGQRDEWMHFSFGELSATASTRRDALAAILPRLKIAPLCTVNGRFLRIRGKLRSYKIHLGSSNILMEPNDQYLCIVPGPGARSAPPGQIYLPFEGDRTLSIILSKAFMLAEDDQIKDPSIVRQIRGS